MLHIIGQYDCKADAKGRVTLPVSLKSQLLPILEKGFVIKRSVFQNCLELYPKEAYDELMESNTECDSWGLMAFGAGYTTQNGTHLAYCGFNDLSSYLDFLYRFHIYI